MTNIIWTAIVIVILLAMSGMGGKVQVSRSVDLQEVFR